MVKPGSHTRLGIELAQQGRTVEALAHLRRAVTSETNSAEVWLWLAHVTPDLNEYHNCVQHVLRLEPDHPTASQMQSDLDYRAMGVSPPAVAADALQNISQRDKRQKRWRRILILLNAILMIALCGRFGSAALDRISLDDINSLFPLMENTKYLRFGVGTEEGALSFEVSVPTTWHLADEGSPSWREQRDRLQAEIPTEAKDYWGEAEADLGEIVFDSAGGMLSRPVVILETDLAQVEAFPANLRLIAVEPLPLDTADTVCNLLKELADAEKADASSTGGFVTADVRARSGVDCVYYLEYLEPEDDTHLFEIAVPVGEDRLAKWHLILPESQYEDYRTHVNIVLNSLRHRPNVEAE